MSTENFDLKKVHGIFKKCVEKDTLVLMRHYIDGYTELSRFFSLFGTIFSFVSSDVESKLKTLDDLHKSTTSGDHYVTVTSMVEHEVSSGILKTSSRKNPSGCRTLLRLHRAMAFIIELFSQLAKMSESDSMGRITADAYNKTLSQHHTWIIRQAVKVAVYGMPTQATVFKKLGEDADVEETRQLLVNLVNTLQPIYELIQAVYKQHDLLELP